MTDLGGVLDGGVGVGVVRHGGVEDGGVEGVVVAGVGVRAADRGVVLDGEAVLVELIEVEGAAEGIRRGEESCATDLRGVRVRLMWIRL